MKTPLTCCIAVFLVDLTAHASWVSDAVNLNAGTIRSITVHKTLGKSATRSSKKSASAKNRNSSSQPQATGGNSSPGDFANNNLVPDGHLRAYFEGALKVVASFESGDVDKFTDVTPDFDTQGLSLGLFGWNIRQGSLQPLIKQVGKEVVLREMPHYGPQFWTACLASRDNGLKIVRSWQDITPGNFAHGQYRKVIWKPEHKEVVSELKHLMGSSEMRSIQMSRAMGRAVFAWSLSCDWARDTRGKGALPTVREFTTFLDTVVQNGDMAGLSYYDVRRWKKAHGDQACKLVCRWLSRVRAPDFQPTDAERNAALWASTFPQYYEQLLLLCWLRAQEAYGSEGLAQSNVLCRRGTILSNNGWVNGRHWEFQQLEERVMVAQR